MPNENPEQKIWQGLQIDFADPFLYDTGVTISVPEYAMTLEILHAVREQTECRAGFAQEVYRVVKSTVTIEQGKPFPEYEALVHSRSPYVTPLLIEDLDGMKEIAEDEPEYALICHAVDELRKLLERKTVH